MHITRSAISKPVKMTPSTSTKGYEPNSTGSERGERCHSPYRAKLATPLTTALRPQRREQAGHSEAARKTRGVPGTVFGERVWVLSSATHHLMVATIF